MSEKTKIYHILNFQTKQVLTSSTDHDKLEKIFVSDEYKKLPLDFIWSYDGEPIMKNKPDGVWLGKRFFPLKKKKD